MVQSLQDYLISCLSNTGSPFTSVWTAIVVVGFSIGGAIGAFSVLRDTMDCIWEVMLPKQQPLWKRIRQKIVPFALVSALGLIVIVWTAIASSLSTVIRFFSINGTLTMITVTVVQVVLSFIVATVLLAIIYKMIPEAKVHWQDVSFSFHNNSHILHSNQLHFWNLHSNLHRHNSHRRSRRLAYYSVVDFCSKRNRSFRS